MNATRGDRTAATMIGVPIEEFMARRKAGLKWCPDCSDWLPVDKFSVNSRRPDRRQGYCRSHAYKRSAVSRANRWA